MGSGTHVISLHLSPMKDRSLAAALLKVSERKGLQDDFHVENIVYCGNEEPFNGWTNVVPTPRYSGSNKPRDPTDNTKRKKTKPRLKPWEEKDSMSDIYLELLGMTSRADDHYHASATLQELYDEYKKKQHGGDSSRLRTMVDPITFRYIPIDERREPYESEDESVVTLPVLKMTHANKQAKLMEVLEKFMGRLPEDKRTATEKYAIKGKDAASFYDKYRWYYKDQGGNITRKVKVKKTKSRKPGRKQLGYAGYVSGSESEDSSSVRRYSKRHSYPPSYVIQIKNDESNSIKEETITFEKKVDYGLSAPGGPGIDRWVARVVIKDNSSKADTDTVTSSTISHSTTNASNVQITKLKQIRSKQPRNAKKQPEYRLTKKKPQRNRRRMPASFYEMYHMSSLETTKVQMNFDINAAAKRQSAITGTSNSTAASSEGQKLEKKSTKNTKPTLVHPLKALDVNDKLEPKAQKVQPLAKSKRTPEIEMDGALAPIEKNKRKKKSPRPSENAGKNASKRQRIKDDKEEALVFTSKQVFESSEARQVKTPSSSTFNPDRMFKQMRDTADFITKAPSLPKANKSFQASTRFLNNIEDARNTSGKAESSNSGVSTRKLLHPKQHRNPAQDKIQQMIDDEKELVSQVIKKLNANWRSGSPLAKLEPVPESLEDALSTAIAKARIYDAQNGLITGRHPSNAMMKRRVVPPMKDKAMTTTTLGSNESFFLPETSTTLASLRPRLPNFKPTVAGKKPDSVRGHTFAKSLRSLSNDRNDTFKTDKSHGGSKFIQESDLLITKPRQSSSPGVFEASISSIKPARRIANVNQAFDVRQRV